MSLSQMPYPDKSQRDRVLYELDIVIERAGRWIGTDPDKSGLMAQAVVQALHQKAMILGLYENKES